MIRAAIAALLTAGLAAGCSERARLNPLDPENARTGGMLPGFQALAGNGFVDLRWVRLTQEGVLGYRIQRWKPGEPPADLGDVDYPPSYAGAVDFDVANDSTYVYRLVAHLASGDSAASPPDTATPGTRRIVVLSAGLPGLVGLTADAREILYAQFSTEAYADVALDSLHAFLWLTRTDAGEVLRRDFNGSTVGVPIAVAGPASVSVSSLRGVGWVGLPDLQQARSYGPDPNSGAAKDSLSSVGHVRALEAGTTDPSVWLGNEEGVVLRFTLDGARAGQWSLGAPVAAIALDEDRRSAYVACGRNGIDDLYRIDTADSTVTPLLAGLQNVVDLAFSRKTRSLWISERGTPNAGNGRLRLATEAGAILMTRSGLEPFGLAIDPAGSSCWVSDLRSNRLLEVSPNGGTLRMSPVLDTPYRQVLYDPDASP